MAIRYGESPLVRAYREVLGVPPGADANDLKKAYRRLALLYHPDRNPGFAADESFRRVREAFDCLRDPARVAALNAESVRAVRDQPVVAGVEITVGSFFGHRRYRPAPRVDRARRLGTERAGERDVDRASLKSAEERDVSILDDPAFDAIEVVYAGKFSVGDDERLQAGLAGAHLRQLPWVILNNQGIAFVLDRDFARALACFAELDERVPNNIIFTYRRGLCHVILGLTRERRGWLGPDFDRAEVRRGLALLKKAVHLGATRSIGKQKCVVIRKLIADVLERLGERRRARRQWREILRLRPRSTEAALRAGLTLPRGR